MEHGLIIKSGSWVSSSLGFIEGAVFLLPDCQIVDMAVEVDPILMKCQCCKTLLFSFDDNAE
jgi:hypothetical protein